MPAVRWSSHPSQIPNVEEITKGLPPWAVVLVVLALAVMAIALALPKVLPLFRDEKSGGKHSGGGGEPMPTPPAGRAATAFANAADANTELVERILDRLDAANTEMKQLRESYEARITHLLADVKQRDEVIFELRARITEAERSVQAARADADRLRWQLDQQYRTGGPPAHW